MKIKQIALLLIFAMFAFETFAMLPTSISNDFWCTWAYVNPNPKEGVSQIIHSANVRGYSVAGKVLENATLCSSTWNFSRAMQYFTSWPQRGLTFIVR